MAEPVQNFRAAFHGFRREDVVQFLEMVTARHAAEVNQLKDDRVRLQQELDALRQRCQQPDMTLQTENDRLREEVNALQEQVAQLRAENTQVLSDLEQATAAPVQEPVPAVKMDWREEELAAYRRAEAMERQAKVRVSQLYDQLNGLVADLGMRLEENQGQMSTAAESLGAALEELQAALDRSQDLLKNGAGSLRVLQVRPEE